MLTAQIDRGRHARQLERLRKNAGERAAWVVVGADDGIESSVTIALDQASHFLARIAKVGILRWLVSYQLLEG